MLPIMPPSTIGTRLDDCSNGNEDSDVMATVMEARTWHVYYTERLMMLNTVSDAGVCGTDSDDRRRGPSGSDLHRVGYGGGNSSL